jgi:elongation factor P
MEWGPAVIMSVRKTSHPTGAGGFSILSGSPRLRGVCPFRSFSMATVGMNDVKNGMKILVNNEPAVITETEYVKPGKGQAFTRMKYRFIKSGRVVEMTMKATDDVEKADVVDTNMDFMYSDGEYWHFMDPETFEQVQATKAGMGGAEKWLKGEEVCIVTLWNGEPIFVQPPNFVELKITETDPGVRGDTSGGGGKPATLETGAVVRVPLFVNQDEIIKVDTRSGEYSARAGK